MEKAKKLIENGADLYYENEIGYKPIHFAAWYGLVEVVRLLLDKNVDVNLRSKSGTSPLYASVQPGNFQANDNNEVLRQIQRVIVCFSGSINVARLLIERGADVNSQASYGWSPLHACGWFGQSEIAKLLLDNEANPNVTDDEESLPLHLAAAHGIFQDESDVISQSIQFNSMIFLKVFRNSTNARGQGN